MADHRGIIAAGMNLTIRQQSHKVENRPAAMTGTARPQRAAMEMADDVEQVVLEAQDRIGAAGGQIIMQKSDIIGGGLGPAVQLPGPPAPGG